MVRRLFMCSIALIIGFSGFYACAITVNKSDYSYVSVTPFIRDYYESLPIVWLVERDAFNKLRQEAENQAKLNRSNVPLTPLVDRPAVTLSLVNRGNAVVYLPIRPIELVDLLPYVQTDGGILESGQTPIKILMRGKSVVFGGRDSAQIVYYMREIANQR